MENGVGQLMIEGIDNAARAEVERLITSVKNITSMIDEKRKTNIHAARRELKNLNGMEIFRDEVLPDSVPLVISRARSVVSELVPIAAKPMKKDEPPTADFEATVNQYILAIGAVNDYDALRWAMEKLFDRCANLMIASQLKKVDDAIAEGSTTSSFCLCHSHCPFKTYFGPALDIRDSNAAALPSDVGCSLSAGVPSPASMQIVELCEREIKEGLTGLPP